MSLTDETAPELTDPELISRVRDGDVGAYGTLFARHVDAATRLARVLVGGPDADDLVSESFVKVLNVLLGGGGPDVAFRAYLLTAVRRLHIDKVRGQQKLTTAGDMTPFDPGVPFTDTAVAGFEGGAAAKAFASLPERWQMVLWHLEVENQKPADIAALLGMSANSVSALAYRAREGLRQAFLNMHSGDLASDDCRDTNDLMGAYVRHALSRRDTAKVEDHLDHCRRCTAVYLELAEVNSSLAGLLGPILLGGAAAAYLGGGTVAAAGAATGVMAAVGRARDVAFGNLPATAATVTAIGIAGVTAIAVVNRGPSEKPAAAEPPGTSIVVPSSTPSPSNNATKAPAGSNAAKRRAAAAANGTTTGSETTTGTSLASAPGSTADADPSSEVAGPTDDGNGNGGNGTATAGTAATAATERQRRQRQRRQRQRQRRQRQRERRQRQRERRERERERRPAPPRSRPTHRPPRHRPTHPPRPPPPDPQHRPVAGLQGRGPARSRHGHRHGPRSPRRARP